MVWYCLKFTNHEYDLRYFKGRGMLTPKAEAENKRKM